MDNQYYISIVVLLTLLTYIMFCRDAMKEYFTQPEKIGRCMNLYSKSKLKGSNIKIVSAPGIRNNAYCPPEICQFNTTLNKCVPAQAHANNQTVKDYCEREQYIENITNKDLCDKLGYIWENSKCNPTIMRKESECPIDTLCQWDGEKSLCKPKNDTTSYSVEDYDSVDDYCQHLKSLSPEVQTMTCQNAGEKYNYNDLIGKCINIDVNSINVFDECWGDKNINDCLNDGKEYTNCVWHATLPSVSTATDIKNLRKTELETIEKESVILDEQLNSYLSSVIPYQKKMDEEQSTKLIIDIIDKGDKDRYKFDTGIKNYQQSYSQSF